MDNFQRLRRNRRKSRTNQNKGKKSGSKGRGPLTNFKADPLSFLDDLEADANAFRESNLAVGPAPGALQLPAAVQPHSLVVQPVQGNYSSMSTSPGVC